MSLLLFLLGCQEEPDNIKIDTKDSIIEEDSEHPCFLDNPDIEIGEGSSAFEPFNQQLEAMMIHGPQGGWHIEIALSLENMLQIMEIEYTIEHLPSGVFVSENHYRIAMIMKGECSGELPGLYGYLTVGELMDGDMDTPPELLGGDDLEITIRVNDCSNSAQAEGLCVYEDRWIEKKITGNCSLRSD
jgi:hypothetical protein